MKSDTIDISHQQMRSHRPIDWIVKTPFKSDSIYTKTQNQNFEQVITSDSNAMTERI